MAPSVRKRSEKSNALVHLRYYTARLTYTGACQQCQILYNDAITDSVVMAALQRAKDTEVTRRNCKPPKVRLQDRKKARL